MRLSPLLALLLLSACTPVDNSGGEPPSGESVTFSVEDAPIGFCEFQDGAALITSIDDVDAWVATCENEDLDRQPVDDAVNALLESQTLVLVTAQLGGCLESSEIAGVFLDGDQLNVWMLKQDTAYGRDNVACTDDLGVAYHLVTADAVASAASLRVGVYNPDLPNGPALDEEE